MLHYSRHTVKRKWIQDSSNFSANDFAPNDDTYVSISFGKRPHLPKTRKMMDKRIQKYFDKAEQDAMFELLRKAKDYIDKEYHPTGYNIGFNCGEDAGQSVMHVHLHLIPRYYGDVENPRGGIRGVIPTKKDY